MSLSIFHDAIARQAVSAQAYERARQAYQDDRTAAGRQSAVSRQHKAADAYREAAKAREAAIGF